MGRAAAQGEWAARGRATSLGVPLTPGMAWLLAVPAAVSDRPEVGAAFFALLHLAALALLAGTARRVFGPAASCWALALAAAAPYAIHSARLLNALTPLSLGGMLCLRAALEPDRAAASRRTVPGLVLTAAAFTLVHPLFLVPVVVTGAMLVPRLAAAARAGAWRPDWRLVAAGGAAALLWAPWLTSLAREGFAPLGPGFSAVGGLLRGEAGRVFGGETLLRAGQWLAAGDAAHLAGDLPAVFGRGAALVEALGPAAAGLLLAGLAGCAWRGRADPAARRLAAWTGGVLVLLWLLPIRKSPPYLSVIYPASCLVIGAALAGARGAWRAVTVAAAAFLLVANVWVLGRAGAWLAAHRGFPGGYGVALAAQAQAADEITARSGGRPAALAWNEPVPVHLVGMAYLLSRRGVRIAPSNAPGAARFYVERVDRPPRPPAGWRLDAPVRCGPLAIRPART